MRATTGTTRGSPWPGRVVAWIGIVSILPGGCYTSSTITPAPCDSAVTIEGRIERVLTKDGKNYEFDRAPRVDNDTIVGPARVTWRSEVKKELTGIPITSVAVAVESRRGKITHVVTTAGAKYVYEEPPTLKDNVLVGKATFAGYAVLSRERVAIPLCDVVEISVSEYNSGRTVVAIVLGAAVVAGIIAASELSGLGQLRFP